VTTFARYAAGMGETTRVSFDAKTIRDLGGSIGRAIAEQLAAKPAEPEPAEPAATAETPGVHIEPWHIFGAREQTIVAAYVDDAAQQRWVPVAREHEVPKAWRKLYVERPA
jgi:hypothetical protein